MAQLTATLREGGVILMPTETVYGLFADSQQASAVEAIYRLKGRDRTKPLSLNVTSLKEIYAFSTHHPDYLDRLYKTFLPGPLTIILEANERVPYWVNAGKATIGFRVPNHSGLLSMIETIGPLAGTSANLSGKTSGHHFQDIQEQFNGQLPGLADDASLSGVDSTVLDLTQTTPTILRQGRISYDAIMAVLQK